MEKKTQLNCTVAKAECRMLIYLFHVSSILLEFWTHLDFWTLLRFLDSSRDIIIPLILRYIKS